MRIGPVDFDREVLVVAEIGNNHEGSYILAEEMIGRAAEAGVGAVKFQTFVPEHYACREDAARLERLQRFRLTAEEFAKLARVAGNEGVLFLSTPLDLESAYILKPIVAAFKIASGDNTFYPLIDTVAGFGKPIILSAGIAGIARLRLAQGHIEAIWSEARIDPGLAVLHCVTSYPVPKEQANLGAIIAIREALKCTVGYSDHTLGTDAAVIAVALGARIIEKHFTLDKGLSDFRDHQLSADPAEMRELVERIEGTLSLLGDGEKTPRPCEQDSAPVRRSIAAGRDLSAGSILTWEDLTWVRPGTGIPPGGESRVLGLRLRRPLSLGALIRPEDLEQPD